MSSITIRLRAKRLIMPRDKKLSRPKRTSPRPVPRPALRSHRSLKKKNAIHRTGKTCTLIMKATIPDSTSLAGLAIMMTINSITISRVQLRLNSIIPMSMIETRTLTSTLSEGKRLSSTLVTKSLITSATMIRLKLSRRLSHLQSNTLTRKRRLKCVHLLKCPLKHLT